VVAVVITRLQANSTGLHSGGNALSSRDLTTEIT
jgi:hypothetical protein